MTPAESRERLEAARYGHAAAAHMRLCRPEIADAAHHALQAWLSANEAAHHANNILARAAERELDARAYEPYD